jgi:hypothetical protein
LRALSNAKADQKKQVKAVQFLVSSVRTTRGEDVEYGADLASWAAFLLERPVFRQALKIGLEETLQGRNVSVTELIDPRIEDMRSMATASYINLLNLVAIDERTVKFVLKAIPNLFKMFQSYLTERRVSPRPKWLDLHALQGLTLLTPWSVSLRTEVGKNPGFLKDILQQVLKDSGIASERLRASLILVQNTLLHTKITSSLAPPLVELAAKVWAELTIQGTWCALLTFSKF